ncbi:hypothetical protein EVAR_53576_1 [Eumeta japonica]|uniref:Uncharacterized protein n=1 Tax=Eumeta variegata TaxID=151549 RepID=A0A4C1YMH5_EUMVA|nr:hypothetical protein EVAR_53576_1 [Eumeta japonica]
MPNLQNEYNHAAIEFFHRNPTSRIVHASAAISVALGAIGTTRPEWRSRNRIGCVRGRTAGGARACAKPAARNNELNK